MAFFMSVKINMDCFDVGIFGVAVMLIVGIVINKVLDYDWNNLVIWKRMMLTSKKCSSTTMKFTFVTFDLKIFDHIRTKLINQFVTMNVKMLDCGWESKSLILDIIIDFWRSYVALKLVAL
ncbi:hypothetical protein CDAR_311271 [Caerostris darwini]|uniref:Uncharacterized protein n=1 Tax=Caerostris darwini TaxID=1538125 RepID=A0AAV4USM7_9ARAC|nr:hypothetical protein CDAR_311271 [Caerostris darwini]